MRLHIENKTEKSGKDRKLQNLLEEHNLKIGRRKQRKIPQAGSRRFRRVLS